MKLYLFRHGETFANKEILVADGYSSIAQLTDLGKEQALNLGRKLASKQLPIIYSSPFDRARQTAEYVASYNHTPIKILPDLREFSFGKAEGLSEEEAFQKYENEFDDGENEIEMEVEIETNANYKDSKELNLQVISHDQKSIYFEYEYESENPEIEIEDEWLKCTINDDNSRTYESKQGEEIRK